MTQMAPPNVAPATSEPQVGELLLTIPHVLFYIVTLVLDPFLLLLWQAVAGVPRL